MSDVAFHLGVADPVAYGCRLLRKVAAAGMRAHVVGPTELLGRLDAALWSFSPLDFLPHAWTADSPSLVNRSPVLFSDALPTEQAPRAVLLNLGAEWNTDAADAVHWVAQHLRVVELVGVQEAAKAAARNRYRAYQRLNHTLTTHQAA
jgi:DNA polymerase III subunit chi